jgi:predicted acyl esterase
MRIDWHVRIPMDDNLELVADVFRPDDEGHYPVILSYGPYAKGLAFQDAYAPQWNKMVEEFPDVAAGSTNKYQKSTSRSNGPRSSRGATAGWACPGSRTTP